VYDYDKEEMADFAFGKRWDEKEWRRKMGIALGPGRRGGIIECSAMSIHISARR